MPVDSSRPSGTPSCGQLAIEAAPALRAPLHRHQHRAAPLAADADALQDPQDDQQDRGGDAPGRPAGQQAHQERRDAHQHQRRDERGLAADPVAVVAEDRGADRPRAEADELHGERGQNPRVCRLAGEEHRREDQGGHRAVEEEVVPLDRGADGAGDDGLPALGADQRVRGGRSGSGHPCLQRADPLCHRSGTRAMPRTDRGGVTHDMAERTAEIVVAAATVGR